MDRKDSFYNGYEVETAEARQERMWRELERTLKAARKSGEFMARLDAAGMDVEDVRTLEDFGRIPPLRKKDLARLQQEKGIEWFLAASPGMLRRIYQSPGPILDPEGRAEDYWGWAEAFYAAGFRSGDLVQMTFSYHLTPAGLMLEEPLHEIGCGVIPAGPGNTDVQLELLTGLPVTGFVGMTSYLKAIGEKAVQQGLDPRKDIQLDVAFVAAEILTDTLRNAVQDTFGMMIRQGYGTADVGCIAYECAALEGMHLSTRCHVEICDPATGVPLPMGEVGEVVVTPFSKSYPLIRLATGDLSRMVAEPCACGRTAPRLAGILGRADDTAKVKGQFVYPSQVAEAVRAFPQVVAHQTVIDNPDGRDTITLRVQVSGPLDHEALGQALRNRIKLNPGLEVLPDGETFPDNAPPLVDKRKYE